MYVQYDQMSTLDQMSTKIDLIKLINLYIRQKFLMVPQMQMVAAAVKNQNRKEPIELEYLKYVL